MRKLKAIWIIFIEIRVRNMSYYCLKFEFGPTSLEELVNF